METEDIIFDFERTCRSYKYRGPAVRDAAKRQRNSILIINIVYTV